MARQRIHYPAEQFLNALAANGASTVLNCMDFRNCVIKVFAPVNTTATIKFVGTVGDTAPTITSAQSETNHYDFIEVIDMQDGSAIAGDTGVLIDNTTAAGNCRLFEVNTNGIDWVGITVAWTDGSVSAAATLTDNK